MPANQYVTDKTARTEKANLFNLGNKASEQSFA